MASLKCLNCGLVNFAGTANCRRCEAPLLNGVPPPGPPFMNSPPPPPPQNFAPYPPPAPGGFAGYPPPPPAPGSYTNYPPPPMNYPVMPPAQQPNAPSYGAPPGAPVYGAPPPPQVFSPPPMPFYGGAYDQAPGVWQDGSMLVATKEIMLPDRCVKCNGPANGYRLKRNMNWHDPLYYLIIFASPLIYAVIAIIVRKKARVYVGLCETHKQNRTIALFVTWSLFAAGIGSFVLAIASKTGTPVLLGIVLLLAAAIYGNFGPRVVYASKIDERFAWIKGVGREYLSQFPQWPRYY